MSVPELVALDEVPEADIVELLRVSLGAESLRTREFWRWKHCDNPFGRSAGIVAVDRMSRPIALRVFLRWELESAGCAIRAVRAVDTATHPDWQRRGLFRTLTERLAEQLAGEGVELIFNTPNPRSLRGYLSMGWSQVGRVPLHLKVRRPLRLALRRGRGGSNAPLEPLGLPPAGEALAGGGVQALCEQRDAGETRLHTRRSAAYLRWRYGAPPAFRYGALFAAEGETRALVIFRLRLRAGGRELSVSELLMDGSTASTRLAAQLCRSAMAATDADYTIASALSGTAEESALRRAGFLPFRVPGPTLAARPLASAMNPDPRLVRSWRLGIGDLELF